MKKVVTYRSETGVAFDTPELAIAEDLKLHKEVAALEHAIAWHITNRTPDGTVGRLQDRLKNVRELIRIAQDSKVAYEAAQLKEHYELYRKENVIHAAALKKEFISGNDGFIYWRPSGFGGCYTPSQLRWLAEALDEKNKDWTARTANDRPGPETTE